MAINEYELMNFMREKLDQYHMSRTEIHYADIFIRSEEKYGGKDFGRNVSCIYDYEFGAFEYILGECINEARRIYYGNIIPMQYNLARYSIYIAVVEKKKGVRLAYKKPVLRRVTDIFFNKIDRDGYIRALVDSINKRGFSVVIFM